MIINAYSFTRYRMSFEQNVDLVLLDMDGTLLDLHYDSHFWLDYVPHAICQ